MSRWLARLAFPALGLLVVLILVGVSVPQEAAAPRAPAQPPGTMLSFEEVVPAPVPVEGPDIVFKWQGADGSWHYADQPPAEGPWNTLAIEPRRSVSPTHPRSPDQPDQDLSYPYAAPFSLSPRYPENGS
ncbi:hypothetical protein SAMN05216203_1746 [Marinobacter daqiaonensis]|uniref:DUF4124 domain-containing protein n=1 Tax=Marinobacter daqiaonensis TaxID=650891 RepID=A0A1I6I2I3_9GAMM|nr:hypothetical protein [Marinobacter daqiaonensis]SFR60869.1 hypothetical protein SAMN05216203_1746 [Marinobacter daqiaonensis]